MAENNINAHCSICGEGYHICNSCTEQKKIKPWRAVVDTIEHYKIYLAIHGYTLSKNKKTARKQLKACDLTGVDNFLPRIKSVINEIMADDKSSYKKEVIKEEINETDLSNKQDEIFE